MASNGTRLMTLLPFCMFSIQPVIHSDPWPCFCREIRKPFSWYPLLSRPMSNYWWLKPWFQSKRIHFLFLSYFSMKTYIVGTHLMCLAEAILNIADSEQSSHTPGHYAPSDACGENFYWRVRKMYISFREWYISMRMLVLSNTIQQVILNACTKFQNPR